MVVVINTSKLERETAPQITAAITNVTENIEKMDGKLPYNAMNGCATKNIRKI